MWGVLSTPREAFYTLWAFYSIAFIAYIWLVWKVPSIPLIHGLILAFAGRFVALWFEPLLSDDYYRFIWDGFILHQGINPVAYTPAELFNSFPGSESLSEVYTQLNSRHYHSVYPPVSQLLFYISFAVNGWNIAGHVIFYKAVLLLADIVVIILLAGILKQLGKSVGLIMIYALNPLIIAEYAGNLHFDNIMLAGLLGAIYFIRRNTLVSGVAMAFSISIKLVSMILMPFMPRDMYWKKLIHWSILSLLLTFTGFYFLFKTNPGWLESVALWFNSFEFNASFYYLAQWIYKILNGYENIRVVGPVMAFVALLLLAGIWHVYLRKKHIHWSAAMVIVLMVYYFMSTTVHPWYIGPALALSVISGQFFPVVWTYLIFLSYSHYINGGFRENYWFIAAEYGLLFLWMIWEIICWPSAKADGNSAL